MLVFRQIVALILLPVLLFASSGQEIFVHKCLVSGNTDVSLLPADKCCGGKMAITQERKQNGTVLNKAKKKCCIYYSFSDQLSVVSFDNQPDVYSVGVPLTESFNFWNNRSSLLLKVAFSFTNSSPPSGFLGGRSILTRNSILRI